MKHSFLGMALAILVVFHSSREGQGQIQALTLAEMSAASDDAIFGDIVGRETLRIDHPIDGNDLYFTLIRIEGRSLTSGQAQTLELCYPGGFLDNGEGVYNSGAPLTKDVAIGNRVVAFHTWVNNMGGDLAARALHAGRGGLYRTFENSHGELIVQGQGLGFAIGGNTRLPELEARLAAVRQVNR